MCFSNVLFLCVFSRLTYSHVFFSCGVQLPCFFLCVLVSSPGEVGGGQGAFGRSPGMTRLAGSEIVENVKLRHQTDPQGGLRFGHGISHAMGDAEVVK